jgi:hypothetical protein
MINLLPVKAAVTTVELKYLIGGQAAVSVCSKGSRK